MRTRAAGLTRTVRRLAAARKRMSLLLPIHLRLPALLKKNGRAAKPEREPAKTEAARLDTRLRLR